MTVPEKINTAFSKKKPFPHGFGHWAEVAWVESLFV
jgi:hypothetical protein